jgi:hypothetical protein
LFAHVLFLHLQLPNVKLQLCLGLASSLLQVAKGRQQTLNPSVQLGLEDLDGCQVAPSGMVFRKRVPHRQRFVDILVLFECQVVGQLRAFEKR